MRVLLTLMIVCVHSGFAQTATGNLLMAKTTGKLPMLAYGLGEDRLGGAKLGYIDTNVIVKVVDSVGERYLVQLSKQHRAYIDKKFIALDSSVKQKPFYLTNSWSVRGDEKYDYLSINMDDRLPYKSWMEAGPAKIMLNLYGVQSNTNWITQLQSAKEIKAVYFNQEEDDVIRVSIELNHQQQWGYSVGYNGNNLVLRVRHQPTDLRFKKLLIAIDAGHGGDNNGAIGVKSNTFEKIYTLRFAEELKKRLEKKGARVVMTRTTDTSFSTADRVLFLQQQMPDMLISLHLNSSGNPGVKGVSTYYKHIGFRPLTTFILNRMLELNLNEFGNVGNFNFTLNAPTDFPNSLVEIAFLSNVEDENRIMDPRFQSAVAGKIYRGIKDWLKSVED